MLQLTPPGQLPRIQIICRSKVCLMVYNIVIVLTLLLKSGFYIHDLQVCCYEKLHHVAIGIAALRASRAC